MKRYIFSFLNEKIKVIFTKKEEKELSENEKKYSKTNLESEIDLSIISESNQNENTDNNDIKIVKISNISDLPSNLKETQLESQKKSKEKNMIQKLFSFCTLEFIYSKLVQSSSYKLILPFQNKTYYTNKYVTVLSFFFIAFVIPQAIIGFSQLDEVQNFQQYESNYLYNRDLSKIHSNIIFFENFNKANDEKEQFRQNQKLPYFVLTNHTIRSKENISCNQYQILSKKEQMDYGYIQLEYDDKDDKLKLFKHPLSCTEFVDRTYMHVNQILGDYVQKHNKEFIEGIPIAMTSSQIDLQNQGLTDLNNVKEFYNDNITFYTNFNKLCTQDSYIQQKFLTNNFGNYIDIRNKSYSLFFQQTQFITFGNSNPFINICSDISWSRQSIFKKHIIIQPQIYTHYIKDAIKSILKHKFYSKNIYYYFKYDNEANANVMDLKDINEQNYQFKENILLLKKQMQVYDIQTNTFYKLISQVSGFSTGIFWIYGIISSFLLPKLFLRSISDYFYQTKQQDKRKGYQSEFRKAKDQNEVNDYMQKVFSIERFANLNIMVDDLQDSLNLKDKEIVNLKNQLENDKDLLVQQIESQQVKLEKQELLIEALQKQNDIQQLQIRNLEDKYDNIFENLKKNE